jgi:hypothetical protein
MRRVAGFDWDRDVEAAFGAEAVLTTAELSWALRISEQVLRVGARAANIAPRKLGRTYAWSRDDARRLLTHLSRARRDTPRP